MFDNSYTYNDIGVIPTKLSEIETRDHIDTNMDFLGCYLSLPVIVSPMSKVVGRNLATKVSDLGGVACLPRCGSYYDYQFSEVLNKSIVSISVKNGYREFSDLILNDKNDSPKIICIYTANGFNKNVERLVLKLKNTDPSLKIITGNVGSVQGFKYLSDLGVDAVRVGIGNGSVCSTSGMTGIGYGQASLVRDCANYKHGTLCQSFIIADGGIHSPADVVKSIALGADVVMAGRIFAGAEESPGQVIKFQGKKYKQYAGEASYVVKKSEKYIEGEDTLVPYSGPVENTWKNFGDGLRSAMSYMNARALDELRFLPDANFVILSASAKAERIIHA